MRNTKQLPITAALLYWFGVCLILAVTYPVSHDYRYGLLTAGKIALIYLEMATCIWVLGIVTWSLLAWMIKNRVYLQAAIAFVLTTAALGGYGIFVFRASRELKYELILGDMHAHFFREYMSLKFSWVTGPLCALLLAVVIVANASLRERRAVS